MKTIKPNDAFSTIDKNKSGTSNIDFIDPVDPKDQLEQQDRYFNQMGDNQNAKFIEQKNDDNKPVGSSNGEYVNDDEISDENPPKEAILHEVKPQKEERSS
jgi:hypothetical protein